MSTPVALELFISILSIEGRGFRKLNSNSRKRHFEVHSLFIDCDLGEAEMQSSVFAR